MAAVIERDGHFLMVEERINGRLVLNQPAGHLEPGESFVDAVTRETHEETGQNIRPKGLVGVYCWPAMANRTHITRLCFFGSIDTPTETSGSDADIIATHWLSASTLVARCADLRSPLVLRAIHDYQAGQRFPLSVARVLTASGVSR